MLKSCGWVVVGGGGGLQDFSVIPRPPGFGFWVWVLGVWGLGLTIGAAMPPRMTHKDVMGKLCGLCLSKLSLRNMSDTALAIIKKYVWAGYTKGESPHRLCGSCYNWLTDVSKSGSIKSAKRKAPATSEKLMGLALPRQTRASASGSSECQCGYCQVGHLSGQRYHNKMKELGIRNDPGPIRKLHSIFALKEYILNGILAFLCDGCHVNVSSIDGIENNQSYQLKKGIHFHGTLKEQK